MREECVCHTLYIMSEIHHIQPPLAPHYDNGISIFLAGGIGECPNWQAQVVKLFEQKYKGRHSLVLCNPRRNEDFAKDDAAAREQITWDFNALQLCDYVLFWFPKESICPIALFELGVQLGGIKGLGVELFVGWHPEYPRRFDLETQIALANPGPTAHSLEELVDQILKLHNPSC